MIKETKVRVRITNRGQFRRRNAIGCKKGLCTLRTVRAQLYTEWARSSAHQ